jgi:hypothetical protein
LEELGVRDPVEESCVIGVLVRQGGREGGGT